jgi:hypothetical protein
MGRHATKIRQTLFISWNALAIRELAMMLMAFQ